MSIRSHALLALSLFAATSLVAAPPDKTRQPQQGNIQVAVDADGKLRPPTVAEQRELQTQTRSIVALQPVTHANGMGSISLGDEFDHTYIVRTAPDGALVFACTDDQDAAARFVAETATIDTILRLKPAPTRRLRVAERE
jgi:CHASE2 domain-containing sensor protein